MVTPPAPPPPDCLSQGERRVLASREFRPARPERSRGTLAPEPKPTLSLGFYLGMALAVIVICVLALIGAATVGVLAAAWVGGWAW